MHSDLGDGTRYNTQAKHLPSQRIGQRGLVRNPKTKPWNKQATEDGRYHRNRKHLWPEKPEIQEKYETRYTVQAKNLPSQRLGQRGLVRNLKTKDWDKQATIVEISNRGRSYIEQGIGGRYHRNRKHIRPDNKILIKGDRR